MSAGIRKGPYDRERVLRAATMDRPMHKNGEKFESNQQYDFR